MSPIIYALGPAGTNAHEAANIAMKMLKRKYGAEYPLQVVFSGKNVGVLEDVGTNGGSFGVAPIENSIARHVSEVEEFWMSYVPKLHSLHVVGELPLPIRHQFLVHPDVSSLEQITAVMSHQQALDQCSVFLDGHGLKNRILHTSTAGAAVEVGRNPAHRLTGAIATELAGQLNGLRVLRSGIGNSANNVTRFHLVSTDPVGPTGNDRTAMIAWVRDKPGALFHLLGCIAFEGVNTSSIDKIPLGPGEYAFYLEFDCHAADDRGRPIIDRIRTVTTRYLVLGSYPQYQPLQ